MALNIVLASNAFSTWRDLVVRILEAELGFEEVRRLRHHGLPNAIAVGWYEGLLQDTWARLSPDVLRHSLDGKLGWNGQPGEIFGALVKSTLLLPVTDGVAAVDRWWETLPPSVKQALYRRNKALAAEVDADSAPLRNVGFGSLIPGTVQHRSTPCNAVALSASPPVSQSPPDLDPNHQAAAAAAVPAVLAAAAGWFADKNIGGGVVAVQGAVFKAVLDGRTWPEIHQKLEEVLARQVVLGKPVRKSLYFRDAIAEAGSAQQSFEWGPDDEMHLRHLCSKQREPRLQERVRSALLARTTGALEGTIQALNTINRAEFFDGVDNPATFVARG